MTDQEFLWHREVRTKPEVEEHFRLDLDIGQARTAIEQLEFMQLKGEWGIRASSGNFYTGKLAGSVHGKELARRGGNWE